MVSPPFLMAFFKVLPSLKLALVANRIPNIITATRFYAVKSSSGSLYKVFGLKQDCTYQDVKEAFYRLSKLYHPDVTNDPSARVKFQELVKAYEILGNPQKRKDYDRGLVNPAASSMGFTGVIDNTFTPDAIHTNDNFSSFYVKHYNRALNEAWFRQCDPEVIKTSLEYKQDERNFVTVVYILLFSGLLLGFAYAKWIEEPVKFITPLEEKK